MLTASKLDPYRFKDNNTWFGGDGAVYSGSRTLGQGYVEALTGCSLDPSRYDLYQAGDTVGTHRPGYGGNPSYCSFIDMEELYDWLYK